MANKKFSEFVLKTSTSDVSHIVGYNGAENVQITPANFVTGGGTGVFLPLAGGTMTGTTNHNDSVYSYWGTGQDLQIGHDGSNSYIIDKGAGDLLLYYSDDFVVSKQGTSEVSIRANQDSSVELFFDNAQKFQTTSTGISVSGAGIIENTSTATSDSVNVLDIKSLSSGTVTAGFGVGLGFFIENSVYSAVNEIGRIEVVETSTTNIDDKMIFYVKDNNTLAERLSIDGDNSRFATSVFINSVYTPNTLAAQLSMGSTADGNNGMSIVSGSTGQGSIFFADESNNDSGKLVYLHSNNSMQFSTNRTLKMLLDSSGNLGIGTSTPSVGLQLGNSASGETKTAIFNSEGGGEVGLTIKSRTNRAKILVADNDSNAYVVAESQKAFFGTSANGDTTNIVVDSSGNLGVGTSSPDAKMHLDGDNTTASPQKLIKLGSNPQDGNGQYIQFSSSGNDSLGSQIQGTRVGVGGSSDLRFITTSNVSSVLERMRLTSAGGLLIDKTTTGEVLTDGLEYSPDNYLSICNSVSANYSLYVANKGTSGTRNMVAFFGTTSIVGSITYNGTVTAYNTTSDYRLKEDLKDFNGLDKVSKIPVYDFKWKSEESRSYGVMAHELAEVLPDAVTGEKDAEENQMVDYSKIVPLLVKSIQELSAKLEALECQCEKK